MLNNEVKGLVFDIISQFPPHGRGAAGWGCCREGFLHNASLQSA